MRFGKTFASYQLAQQDGLEKVAGSHLQTRRAKRVGRRLEIASSTFAGWQFISPGGLSYEEANKTEPFVCFGSFQDYLGKNPSFGRHQNQKRMGSRHATGIA